MTRTTTWEGMVRREEKQHELLGRKTGMGGQSFVGPADKGKGERSTNWQGGVLRVKKNEGKLTGEAGGIG